SPPRPHRRRRGGSRLHRLVGGVEQRRVGRTVGLRHGRTPTLQARSVRPDIETDQYLFGVGEVADDTFQRFRQLADQGRDGDNLVPRGLRRILHQVDDFYLVAARQVGVADLL